MPNWNIILTLATGRMSSKARELAPTLEEYIKALYASGMPVADIRSRLLGDEGERLIFAPIRNAFGLSSSNSLEEVRQTVRQVTFKENTTGKELFRWVTNPAKNHCEDCLENEAREPMTMEEWELIGTPKAYITRCGDRCGCDLALVR